MTDPKSASEQVPPAAEEPYRGRPLTFWRKQLYRLAVPVGMLLIRFFWWSCRVVRVVTADGVDVAVRSGPIIPVYWHQHQLFCTRHLLTMRSIGVKPGFLISPSVDGEIPAMIAKAERAYVIRGSSSHTGARALRDYYVALQTGVSPAITVDGPYGPAFECKPGAVMLAQLSGRPVVAMSFCAERAWLFRAWDRFVLPWPFARVVMAVGAPRYVPKGLDPVRMQALQDEITAELKELYRAARDTLA